jgi:hypothetical protein
MQGQLIWVQIRTRRAYKINIKSWYGTRTPTSEVHWFYIRKLRGIFLSQRWVPRESCLMKSSACYEDDEIKKRHVTGGVRNVYGVLIGIPEWKRPWRKWEGDLSSHSMSQCTLAADKNRVLSHKKYFTTTFVVVWLFRSCGPRRFCGSFTECKIFPFSGGMSYNS